MLFLNILFIIYLNYFFMKKKVLLLIVAFVGLSAIFSVEAYSIITGGKIRCLKNEPTRCQAVCRAGDHLVYSLDSGLRGKGFVTLCPVCGSPDEDPEFIGAEDVDTQ